MPTTLEIVRGLSSSQVAQVSEELFDVVYAQVPYEDVRRNSEAVAEVAPLLSLDNEALKRKMSADESTRFGRLVLEQYALHSEFAPFVRQACENVQSTDADNDDLVVGVLLAVGLVVNLTLLIATTELQIERAADGTTTWKLTKKQPTPKLLKAVIEPFVNVFIS